MVQNDAKCRTIVVEEESLSAYVTSSFRSSNEFHIYKRTEDFYLLYE